MRQLRAAADLRRQRRGLVRIDVEEANLGDGKLGQRERDRFADAAGADDRDRAAPAKLSTRGWTARRKPLASVLWPMRRPSRTTTVLTAPIAAARRRQRVEQPDHRFFVGEGDVDAGEAEARTP